MMQGMMGTNEGMMRRMMGTIEGMMKGTVGTTLRTWGTFVWTLWGMFRSMCLGPLVLGVNLSSLSATYVRLQHSQTATKNKVFPMHCPMLPPPLLPK